MKAWKQPSGLSRTRISESLRLWRHVWRWVGYALTGAALGYIAFTLGQSGQQIQHMGGWRSYIPAIGLTLALHLLSFLLQLFVWLRLIACRNPVGWRDVEIYTRMVLLRYLPGGFWQWVGRATEYKAVTSVPARVIVLANFSEWGLLLLVALALYLFTGVGFAGPHWGQMGLGALALASALGLGIRWQPKSRSRRLRLAESVLWIACYGVAWFLGGAIVYLWVRYSGSQLLEWSQAIRIWTLTGGIGFISSLVAGLMIREITLTWLLQPYLPVASGLLVALLIRVLFTLADVLWAGAGWALSRYFLSGRGRFGSNFVEMEQLQ